jgi:CRISPR-associated endonuclease/helicase Cas3
MKTFWAHSDRLGLAEDDPNAHWQPLAEHLVHVGSLARQLASLTAPTNTHFQELAEWAGLLHDFGKYTDCFQERVRGSKRKCPHAIHGAALAWRLGARHIAHAIAGHHAGILDQLGGSKSLQEGTKRYEAESRALCDRAIHDCVDLGRVLQQPTLAIESLAPHRFDLFTRMLFSCLIDADRLDTSARQIVQAPLDAASRMDALLSHIRGLQARDCAAAVKSARREVLEDCLAAAEYSERLLSLSVPTGGGKTLSAMAFALRRATLHPDMYRRIIVVIPFLSIIEQNAEVYASVFGTHAVLEHHSGSFERLRVREDNRNEHFIPVEEDEDQRQSPGSRPETENWDAPLIVTTSVRFFESLFSNHPSDLRRIHNIARSIVILDEVQVLPRSLLGPLLEIIRELADDWGCCFVLSTATKPAFEKGAQESKLRFGGDLRWHPGTIREIVHEPKDLHTRLRRVTIEWRIKQPADWPQVADWMQEHSQALCVVNTRDHASRLFDELLARHLNADSLFHLSTRMCAAHRLERIQMIRGRLHRGFPCLVVSTQLIEAGVDVDFPVAFRALGPLDSIIQTAGRADREGKMTAAAGVPAGKLIVFLPRDHKMPPGAYEEAAGKTQSLASIRDIQCDDLDAMAMFFERYYGEGADLGTEYVQHRRKAEFATLAEKFELISSRTQDVFVPFGEGKELLEKLWAIGQLTGELRRELQRFTVGLQPWEFAIARSNVLTEVRPDTNLWVATDAAYSERKGLESTITPESLIR